MLLMALDQRPEQSEQAIQLSDSAMNTCCRLIGDTTIALGTCFRLDACLLAWVLMESYHFRFQIPHHWRQHPRGRMAGIPVARSV